MDFMLNPDADFRVADRPREEQARSPPAAGR
jgi:hypothetical protein